jgi:hypothetical protein
MVLIRRGPGRVYLKKSVRRGKRTTSIIVASGADAVLIAKLEGIRHERRRLEALDRARMTREDAALVALDRVVEAVAHAAIEDAGYVRHHREWRKRAMRRTRIVDQAAPAPLAAPEVGTEALVELERALAATVTGGDLAGEAARICEVHRMADELAGADATAVERLLALRIATLEHALTRIEIHAALAFDKGVSLPTAEFLEKRFDGAHRRFLRAILTLATVRKLTRPTAATAVSVTIERP